MSTTMDETHNPLMNQVVQPSNPAAEVSAEEVTAAVESVEPSDSTNLESQPMEAQQQPQQQQQQPESKEEIEEDELSDDDDEQDSQEPSAAKRTAEQMERSNGNNNDTVVKRSTKRSKSNYKGVFKCGKKFKAQIQTHGVQHYLGLFDTEEEAARAYDNHARMVLGPKAKTNFPFDPRESQGQTSYIPVQPPLPPPPKPTDMKIANSATGSTEDKDLLAKRSYVGMKIRKKAAKDMMDPSKSVALNGLGSGITLMSAIPSSTERHGKLDTNPVRLQSNPTGLIHVPLPLMQNPYMLNNLPQGYHPVLNSVRFIPNSAFGNLAATYAPPSAGSVPSSVGRDLVYDWAKHTYPMGVSQMASTQPHEPISARNNHIPSMTQILPSQSGHLTNQFSQPQPQPQLQTQSQLQPQPQSQPIISAVPHSATSSLQSIQHHPMSISSQNAILPVHNNSSSYASPAAKLPSISHASNLLHVENKSMTTTANHTGASNPASISAVASPTTSNSSHSNAQLLHAQNLIFMHQQQQLQRQSQAQARPSHSAATPVATIPVSSVPMTSIQLPKQPQVPIPTSSEPDWHDQIYYWAGRLDYDDRMRCLMWKGKWVGSFTGKPSKEEFESSNQEFVYQSPQIEKTRIFPHGGFLRPCNGYYKGHYMVQPDGGNGLDKFVDKEVVIEFEELSGRLTPFYNVYGKGDNEFGVFILHGTFDAAHRSLEMTRQYLEENDPRMSMSLMQLKQCFKKGMMSK